MGAEFKVFVYTKEAGPETVAQVEVTLRNEARDIVERELKADDVLEGLVTVQTVDGEEIMRKDYSDVELPAGRSFVNLPPFSLDNLQNEFYAFRYMVIDAN